MVVGMARIIVAVCCSADKLAQRPWTRMLPSSEMTSHMTRGEPDLVIIQSICLTRCSLSSSRFLKTILARHANGPLVLKIFIKPDPNMSLRLAQRRLKSELGGGAAADE